MKKSMLGLLSILVCCFLLFGMIPQAALAEESFSGTIEWNSADVRFKGTTAYVIYDGQAHTPRFTVKDSAGKIVDSANYDYEYRENTKAGTGYVFVTFTNEYSGECQASFKIYLPATTQTSVANVDKGIKITWSPVNGAAGYVIYRRAWSSTTNGWTAFARWDNTTGTTYIDGADASHKVYAGTRYQYGVKAYFARRLDPITGTEIGGNVNDPPGNFNLGEVGPLKTTVRITTRKLNSVTPGDKKLTAKWDGSSLFTGYQVQIATNNAFTKNAKTVKITNAKTTQTVIKNLKASTTYYVRVRSYHVFKGTTYYGGWSNVKTNEKTQIYVLNTSTFKFHNPSCGDVKKMSSANKQVYEGTRSSVIEMGYSPCGHCKP